MTIMAISSEACAGPAIGDLDSLDDYGEAGEKIEGSVRNFWFEQYYLDMAEITAPAVKAIMFRAIGDARARNKVA